VKAFLAPPVQGTFGINAVSGGGTPPGSAASTDHGASDLNINFCRGAGDKSEPESRDGNIR
jgi:hypothetical protein